MKFHITAQGDRTVGDGTHEAIVDIPYAVTDPEYAADVREQLKIAFRAIFDNLRVLVLTEEEYWKRNLGIEPPPEASFSKETEWETTDTKVRSEIRYQLELQKRSGSRLVAITPSAWVGGIDAALNLLKEPK